MFKTNNPLLKNIQTISEVMNYSDDDLSLMSGSGYYFTWVGKKEEDVKEIFDKTGIECSLSGAGVLLVPEFSSFKSEKEKKLLMDLGQYGLTMTYLDLCKKLDRKDLSVICKELFRELYYTRSEEEFRSILENVISKIS